MGVTYNLATKTVKNTGETDVILRELIEIVTILAPNDKKILSDNTKVLEINT